ncbi:MAG: hypothetical protein ACM3JC_01665, partial [Rudaea sp.]
MRVPAVGLGHARPIIRSRASTASPPRHIRLERELIVRDSTAPPAMKCRSRGLSRSIHRDPTPRLSSTT